LLCATPDAPGVVAAGDVVEVLRLAALAVPSMLVPAMAPAPGRGGQGGHCDPFPNDHDVPSRAPVGASLDNFVAGPVEALSATRGGRISRQTR